MIRFFRMCLPVIVILGTIVNLIASYGVNNDAAFSANVTALFGWAIVAMDEYSRDKEVV